MWNRRILMHNMTIDDDKIMIPSLLIECAWHKFGPMVTASGKFEFGIIAYLLKQKRGIEVEISHRGIETMSGIGMHEARPDEMIAMRSDSRTGRRDFVVTFGKLAPIDGNILPVGKLIDHIPERAVW